jgi:hypothetical protein
MYLIACRDPTKISSRFIKHLDRDTSNVCVFTSLASMLYIQSNLDAR